MGDFNTCLLKRDSRSLLLENITNSSNLTMLPLSATHHFPNCTPSLPGLILVSSPSFVSTFGQCSADAFFYHDLIYISYKLRPPKSKTKVIMQRNFSKIVVENLIRDAKKINWSEVYNAVSVDEKVHVFNTALIKLYDSHAPIRPIKIKHLPAPWLTEDIKSLQKKCSARTKYKHKPTEENRSKFIKIRNLCNRVCRDAQRRYIHKSLDIDDSTKMWKFLKTLGVGKPSNNSIPKDLNIELLNQHFSSSASLDRQSKLNTLRCLSNLSTPIYPSFAFSQFSDRDVRKSILSISSNAVGCDSISRNMIVPILDVITPVITHVLNCSITSSTFPDSWKQAQVIPLPKKVNPVLFSEYRPISILPFLSKVLERLIYQQFSIFLNTNSLINPLQSGFRPGYSTTSALVKITDDIRYGMGNGLLTILSLLDFSSAFNNVDFDILLGILCSLNISPTSIGWFRSYLFGRRQRIRIDDVYSSWCDLSAGVPQGGVLSPLLFAIFINSISNNLSSSYHLYADDLQIYTQANLDGLHKAVATTNRDFSKIVEWSKAYGLSVNPQKTKVIIVGSSRLISKIDWCNLPQIEFDGEIVDISETVKNLGIVIDRELSWRPHLTNLSRRIFASAASLRRLKNFLPTATKVMLAQSLLLPILDYADASYIDLTQEQLNKLDRLQNVCIRFIFGLRKYDHVSEYRKKLKWLPIRLRRNVHLLSLLYNILFDPRTPPYLKERFDFLHLSHSRYLRSSNNLSLMTPVHTSSFVDNSFTVQAVRLWNSLPLNIRQAKSILSFKLMVTKYFWSSQV